MAKKKKVRHNIRVKFYRNKRIEEEQVLKDAVQFFLDELLKRCTIRHVVNVDVTVTKGDIITEDGHANAGLCSGYWKDDQYWYTIHASGNVPFLELLSTIAHESVHVAQYVTGRLRGDDRYIWDGVDYGEDPYKNPDLDSKLPWEYDAYSKEPILARKFVTKYYSTW